MKYSVLMSVYYKEKPSNLEAAINSIFNQTELTDDFVLICDGPLTPELDEIIQNKKTQHEKILNVIRLEKNGGLGNALNIGIKHCKNELVARMDSDDISFYDRCEKQLNVFEKYPDISICSGIVNEFTDSPEKTDSQRVPPETSDKIYEFAKKRNPFNHPCVMYKKSDVLNSGSYQDFFLLEDYYLWLRMLLKGYKGYNIQEPLLYMRAGSEMYRRRSGIKYALSQAKLFKFMKDNKLISELDFIISVFSRLVASVVPNSIRKKAFSLILRK